MAKKLISLKNVQELCAAELHSSNSKELYLDPSWILTPSAQDYLQTQGLMVKSGKKAQSLFSETGSSQEALVKKISEIVITNHKLTDKDLISKIVLLVLQKINNKKLI
ncbi:MAG: hypothetical protein ACRC5H_01655 [Treponemataceae bacterium]